MTTTFREANHARAALKMKLSNNYWYISSRIDLNDDDYCIVVNVKLLDNQVRKTIPPVFNNVSVRTELDKR